MNRVCGECSACCKVMEVKEIQKPAGCWCPHWIANKGCGIYQTRPQSCDDYKCQWLLGNLEERDRPDKLGIILDYQDDLLGDEKVLLVREISPGTVERSKVKKLIDFYAKTYVVLVQHCSGARTVKGPWADMQRIIGKMKDAELQARSKSS